MGNAEPTPAGEHQQHADGQHDDNARREHAALLGVRVLELLGVGAFSRVYRVAAYLARGPADRTDSPSVQCALKVMPRSVVKTADDWQQLLIEREMLAADCTPHATALYATYADAHYLYILMQLAPNGSLKWLLRAVQQLQSAPSTEPIDFESTSNQEHQEHHEHQEHQDHHEHDHHHEHQDHHEHHEHHEHQDHQDHHEHHHEHHEHQDHQEHHHHHEHHEQDKAEQEHKHGKQGLEEELLRSIAAELCAAVSKLHEGGYLCRDIKPENVLIGLDGHIKLSDFGLAMRLPSGEEERTVCGFSGTLAYLSPELLSSKEGRHGVAHDWWAVGVVLYLAGCFDYPFDVALNDSKQLFHCISDPLQLPRLDRLAHLSPDGQDFIGRLLHKDPHRRLTGEQAMQHVWIAQATDCSSQVARLVHDLRQRTTDEEKEAFQFRAGEADLVGQYLFIPFGELPTRPTDSHDFRLAHKLPPFPGAASLMHSPSFPAPSPPFDRVLGQLDAAHAEIERLEALIACQRQTIEQQQLEIRRLQHLVDQASHPE